MPIWRLQPGFSSATAICADSSTAFDAVDPLPGSYSKCSLRNTAQADISNWENAVADFGPQFTVSFWFFIDDGLSSASAVNLIMELVLGPVGQGTTNLAIHADLNTKLDLFLTSGALWQTLRFTESIPITNRWIHVVFTSNLNMFIDGVPKIGAGASFLTYGESMDNKFTVGDANTRLTITEFKVFNVVFTVTEAQAITTTDTQGKFYYCLYSIHILNVFCSMIVAKNVDLLIESTI